MNIVISAYECSPDHGSEAGLGWNWVMAAAKYADFDRVHVITTDRHERNIRAYAAQHGDAVKKLAFHFLPLPLSGMTKLNQRFKYMLWQRDVGKLARALCEKEDIAFLHHITWATCVLPTYLYRGGAPFIYGPVGGGERIPRGVKLEMNRRDAFVEWVRNTVASTAVHMPPNRRAYREAALILSTTEETKRLLPAGQRHKVRIMQSVGINALPEAGCGQESENGEFVVLLAARMLCWKGVDIAIEAMRKMAKRDGRVKLVIAGTGRNLEAYRQRAAGLENVEFLGEVPHARMEELYRRADVLLNCSLHDSGCMVILEAMSHGLPVVAIRTGGPAVIADEGCAAFIEPGEVGRMTEDICQSILLLKGDGERRRRMAEHGRRRALEEFSYSAKYDRILAELRGAI